MKIRKIVTLFTAVLLAGLLAMFYLFFIYAPNPPSPYSYFYEQLEKGNVEEVKIRKNKIDFKLKDLPTTFITENPQSPLLKEKLLLKDVYIEEEKGFEETFSFIFDLLFYLIFIGAILVVFRKFIGPNSFKTVHKTGVLFKDIIGMDGLKKDMLQIINIMKNPTKYKNLGIRMPKGILLEGEPGNGKTLFARALAGEAKVNFIPAKATDFESMFMAIGPAKVKLLFRKARRSAPCIVFIDEFDGIGTKRNYSGSAIETENTRIVTALLNELDGFKQNSGILVMAATNSKDALDEALIRPGRFDAKYKIPYPDLTTREELIKMYSSNKLPLECPVEQLARNFNGFSCAQIESILNRAALLAQQNSHEKITLEDIKNSEKEN